MDCGPIPSVTLARRSHGRALLLDGSLTRVLPSHKTTARAANVTGLQLAIAAGADEALFTTGDGCILEGTSTNVFATCADRLVTAPASAGVLPGVVREWVIAEARRAGFPLEERAPAPAEVRAGSFFTGSLTMLAAIQSLDGEPCVEPKSMFSHLQEQWTKLLREPGG